MLMLPFLLFQNAYAADPSGRGITPYGDTCDLCGDYGYCGREPTHREVVGALRSYYGKRGMEALVREPKGRFVEVEIYKNGRTVDRVLLDLKTGRIRSVY